MKNLFEGYISTTILAFMVFVIISLFGMETQVITARRVHASAIEQVQNSYYTVDMADLNNRIHEQYPSWEISAEPVDLTNGRQDWIVTLDYTVTVPLFNVTKEGRIQGYAR